MWCSPLPLPHSVQPMVSADEGKRHTTRASGQPRVNRLCTGSDDGRRDRKAHCRVRCHPRHPQSSTLSVGRRGRVLSSFAYFCCGGGRLWPHWPRTITHLAVCPPGGQPGGRRGAPSRPVVWAHGRRKVCNCMSSRSAGDEGGEECLVWCLWHVREDVGAAVRASSCRWCLFSCTFTDHPSLTIVVHGDVSRRPSTLFPAKTPGDAPSLVSQPPTLRTNVPCLRCLSLSNAACCLRMNKNCGLQKDYRLQRP